MDATRLDLHPQQQSGLYYHASGAEVELFEQADRFGMPVLIKGPTGCGKTRFIQHMADRLGRKLYTVACHDDLTTADLVGRHLIGANGTFWQDGPLTRAVREGAICYLDEVIEARKDITVVLHPLADDRRILPLEATGEELQAAPGFMLVVSYNPGYRNLLKGLKPSTRQRFVAMAFDYPEAVAESRILQHESGLDPAQANQLVALGNALRHLGQHDLEEAPSTRLLIHTGRLIAAGMDPRQACEACMAQPLTDEPTAQAAIMDIVRVHFAETGQQPTRRTA
ncbi:CbbQ/NirQ/NorQ/GpvN family protein [Halopseudomonas bauzanensis]|uniref:CbbQ/NirQ/NorQ/GpvN family protein n=1 Tax=Halopseudomonas bauzanensis TaxID=653930 RepID=A0A031MIQ5_9GAMM|nr:CbbQ/NirQ/NorQ/GpvN family protein [Halopseudomonas bauzanensis]EZQ19308.1 ATPase AAA [Halopseudomonas bauzanensis]TKA90864.1 CbbQ/NirQ/NorQ/GpvN family protein [Halopseudomonas bauzanensis]SER60591.1 nitric oxide reductase NorQ protein [Halopseudomonas bauzanensis]SFL65353.1 nitric oxide reductase NorQ protein [Halopseudomonas bauzanensis]